MEGSRSRSRSRRNQTTITDRNNSTPVVSGGGVRPQSPYLIRNGSRSKSKSKSNSRGGGATILTSNIISSSSAPPPPPPPAEVPPLTPPIPIPIPIHSSTRNSSTATKAATISGSRKIISRGGEDENTSTSNNLVGILSQRYEFHMNYYADPIIKERKFKSNNNNTNNSVPPITKQTRSRSATNSPSPSPSPSAWALSPGRTPSPMTRSLDKVIGSGSNGGGGAKVKSSGGTGGATEKVKSGGGMSVVLKYFRSNKKVSSIQEEAFHRYRVLHTRLVQWRLVNARAEVAILNRNSVAEKKLFNVWLRTYQLRNSVLEKRIQVQKLKNEIKLLRVINPQLRLLDEWTKIEKRNSEAVAKLSRNLMASSFRLPLIKGAKAETVSMYRVMYTALNVMNDIEETMERTFFEAEEKVLLVNEIKETIRLEAEGLEELRKTVSMVAALEAQEKSLRVYVIQTAKEGFVER